MWITRLRQPLLLSPRAISLRRPLSSLRSSNSHRGPRNSIRRPERIQSTPKESQTPQQPESGNTEPQDGPNENYDPAQNTLLSPVHVPEDPNAVLKETHPAISILANSGLVVQRQFEMMNVMIGFEQANKYVIMDAMGNHIGYMAEQEKGMGNAMARQWFKTHRSFVTHVFDRNENEVLRFNRPFSWINTRIQVYDPIDPATNNYSSSTSQHTTFPGSLVQTDTATRVSQLGFDQMRIVGEAQSQWAPLRRKYNLFTYHQSPNPATDMGSQKFDLGSSDLSKVQQTQLAEISKQGQGDFNQFAYVDEPMLSWDFSLVSAENRLIGSVNRNFAGFAREIFTDTGVYALRMDSAGLGLVQAPNEANAPTGMTLDQRAVMLATAVSVDFDYFSRHSSSGGGFGFMPLWFPGMGGGAAAGEAAGGAAAGGAAAGEAGAIGEAATGAIGRAGAAGGIADGMAAGATGAGAMAGYEAMQRGMSGDQSNQSAYPDQQPLDQQPLDQQPLDQQPLDQQPPEQTGPYGDAWPQEQPDDVWGEGEDPWSDDGDGGGGDDFDFF
ncbi:Scramblase-domain-containing protein [Penicillium atrosanguineum]|uniref:Scramblase-domain-containing protein n=1 Tax=Penicillium atrosanguineum TaxID=1132637 RepID=A0A9W9U861_9EURO|nr:Scramblase-domain-containing protein [Penicillium atrosanguineum]